MKKGIKLIQIFEDEWRDKQEIIKSILLNKFNKITNIIDSDCCQIYSIKDEYAKQFIKDNSLNEFINNYHFGLSYKNELVSLITVEKKYENNIKILNNCTKINLKVKNSLMRLINYIQRLYVNKNITFHSDLRYNTYGNEFKEVGFLPIKITDPNYSYFYNGNRYSKNNKVELISDNFDSIELKNNQLNKYDRIWDCGDVVYIKRN